VLSDLLQFVAFVDAGNVWDQRRNRDRRNRDALVLYATPGFGVRVASPFGPIRVDFGYNKHPPSPGAIFYEDVNRDERPLYCVTPGNDIEVVNHARDDEPAFFQPLSSTTCPTTYEGKGRRGWRAFNISLAIAQAF
jgi:hypothetical protein